jgi:protein-disulfide isomerase
LKKLTYLMAVCLMAVAASVACAQETADDPIVAKIGDEVITESQFESMAGPSLVSLRQQLYKAKVDQLNAQIFDRLIGQLATAEGLTRADYLKKNVADKVTDPDEGEIVKVMSQYRAQLAQDDAQARQQVIQALRQQKEVTLAEELRKRIFAENNVEILFEPPRVEVAIPEGTPYRGDRNAPIVMVEYTDYQCPYCSRVQGTLDTVMKRYEGKIVHVFKNLPLPFHTEAELAGQAALCAQDQGKFWELHDWLFANARNINIESMSAAMGNLEADVDLFKACIEQGTYAEKVREDSREARSFGITGTPGFLINGRVLTGAQPLDAFVQVIDEELERQGIEVPKAEPEVAAK